MAEGIQGLQNLLKRVAELATDVTHVDRALEAAGEIAIASVIQNFQAEGRPEKWKALSPKTLAGRRRGKGKGGPKILTDSGRLRNSFSKRLVSGTGIEIGTNVKYAKRQNFGYPGGAGRGHSKTPARPFALLQNSDVDAIGMLFRKHISR